MFGPRELDRRHRRLYWWAYRFLAASVVLLVLLIVKVTMRALKKLTAGSATELGQLPGPTRRGARVVQDNLNAAIAAGTRPPAAVAVLHRWSEYRAYRVVLAEDNLSVMDAKRSKTK